MRCAGRSTEAEKGGSEEQSGDSEEQGGEKVMAMRLTNWGYSVDGELTDFLTETEFDMFTADKFAGDARTGSNIKSATAAIRNYCGWHLYPELPCELSTTFFDRRVSEGRGGILIQLPAKFVTGITSITIDGTACTNYILDPSGLLKVYEVPPCMEYSPIVIQYTAGLSSDMMDAIKELTAHRVTHAVSSSYGVTSEAAGGVSVTYNASWAGNTQTSSLPDDSKEVLLPYRIGGVF